MPQFQKIHILRVISAIKDLFFPASTPASTRDGSLRADILALSFPVLLEEVKKSDYSSQKDNLFVLRSGYHAVACLPYKQPLIRKLIHNIKTKHHAVAFQCAGFILAENLILNKEKIFSSTISFSSKEALSKNNKDKITVIIPVPIRPKRRRERGYNQCDLLADSMIKFLEPQFDQANMELQIKVRKDILFRKKQNGTQKKQSSKSRAKRISEMSDAFYVNKKILRENPLLAEQNILIIDDVLTTGSTLNEAAETLKNAGYKNIGALALAH